jgi:hypothetical protein
VEAAIVAKNRQLRDIFKEVETMLPFSCGFCWPGTGWCWDGFGGKTNRNSVLSGGKEPLFAG